MNNSLTQTQWPKLLGLTLQALDSLHDEYQWSWGGGTALSTQLDHRISFDIDIFFTNADALRAISPQNNSIVRKITKKWQQPGHYIKLERKEGEIDFIVSQFFTTPGTAPWHHKGRDLPRETVREILAKNCTGGARTFWHAMFLISLHRGNLPRRSFTQPWRRYPRGL